MLTLTAIRDCLEGAVPATLATCAPDGTPNVTFVSQVHYVDPERVALTYQFFNKTRENVLANPRATALLIDPATAAQYRLALEYLRTECEGPIFESMKAKLSGIASHTGMAGVFRLRGSDIYRVASIERVPGAELPAPPRPNMLAALRCCSLRTARATDLASLLDETLAGLDEAFAIRHAMVLMVDQAGSRLYTVASRGYPQSGVGSEIAMGCGVIGVAACERTPIRIGYMTAEYSYGRAIRESLEREGLGGRLETSIPLPGLPDARSQLAVPIPWGARVLGVLYVESSEDQRFDYDCEDALVALAAQLGLAVHAFEQAAAVEESALATPAAAGPAGGDAAVVRHYAADDSVFVDDDYLIKGVAGSILVKLLRDWLRDRRCEFTNRELRLDPAIRLPDVSDNLEARLVLLARRLEERTRFLRIERTGRGRFQLRVERPLRLEEIAAARAR